MNFSDNIKMSVSQMKKNSMRALLTILGIVIGIAAMIAVFSVGQAGRDRIKWELDNLGINRIWIMPNGEAGSSLEIEDAELLSSYVSNIKYVGSTASTVGSASSEKAGASCDITGVTESISKMENKKMEEGRHISAADVLYSRNVAVLSNKAKRELFGEEQKAEGKKIDVNGMKMSVIGVEAPVAQIYDEFFLGKCYIPITTYANVYGTDKVTQISVMADDSERIEDVVSASGRLLATKYGDEKIKIINLASEMENANNIMDIFTLVLSAIAAISLLVGGIGIMNVMLMTIKERTREIGIRKALGATPKDIMNQFLTESVVYAFVGGLIGAIFGCFMTVGFAKLINLDVILSPWPIIGSVSFSAAVGLIFGILPAKKAAALDPVIALREE